MDEGTVPRVRPGVCVFKIQFKHVACIGVDIYSNRCICIYLQYLSLTITDGCKYSTMCPSWCVCYRSNLKVWRVLVRTYMIQTGVYICIYLKYVSLTISDRCRYSTICPQR